MARNLILFLFIINSWQTTFKDMWILSMMELNIVVKVVTIKQLQKATFKDMWYLSMMKLNIVVNIVTIKQQQKAAFEHMCNLSM